MKVKITEYRNALLKIAKDNGASDDLARDLVDASLAHELKDNFFSGFKGVHGIDDWIEKIKTTMTIEEELVVDKPSLKVYDGTGKSPLHIILERYKEFCKLASENGALTVGIHGEYMSALFYTVQKFADDGYMVILASNGGPATTVPYGGRNRMFGTNPLAYGIPSSSESLVFDGATSKRAYGLIGEAKRTGGELPENAFLDIEGEFTTDPEKADGIEPFGEYKGYAINLLLEMMTSTLLGGVAGREQDGKDHLGTWLYVVDPGVFGDKKRFLEQADRIKQEIVDTKPQDGYERVVYPGQRGYEHEKQVLAAGVIDFDDEVWVKISKLAEA